MAAQGRSPDPAPGRAYWDAAAAPLHPLGRQVLLAALDDGWADPRRLHHEGRRASLLLEGARESVAASLGARTEEVTFAPSHTQALHTAVLGTLAARRRTGGTLVASAVEHSAVLAAGRRQADTGGTLELVPVDGVGRVRLPPWREAVASPGVAVAALQLANAEVGTCQPVTLAHEAARSVGVPLVVDAAAAAGHVPVPAAWDVLAADAQGWGGPAGVGVLAVRAGTRFRSPWPQDEHERGRAPGGVSVPAALAAATVLAERVGSLAADDARRRAVVAGLRWGIPAAVPDVEVVGDPADRLPQVLTFSCLFADGEALVTELDRVGFAVGSGSACTSSTLEPSHVLAAMGALTHGNVRIVLPPGQPPGVLEAQADRFLTVLPDAVRRVRAALGGAGL